MDINKLKKLSKSTKVAEFTEIDVVKNSNKNKLNEIKKDIQKKEEKDQSQIYNKRKAKKPTDFLQLEIDRLHRSYTRNQLSLKQLIIEVYIRIEQSLGFSIPREIKRKSVNKWIKSLNSKKFPSYCEDLMVLLREDIKSKSALNVDRTRNIFRLKKLMELEIKLMESYNNNQEDNRE